MRDALNAAVSVVVCAFAISCSGSPAAPSKDDIEMTNAPTSKPPIEVSLSASDDRLIWQIENTSAATVHIMNGSRMPYLLADADGSLQLLLGVNPPDPDIDYPIIEIPVTAPLAAGQTIRGETSLLPVKLRDHYGGIPGGDKIHGNVQIRLRVGWLTDEVKASDVHKLNIQTILDRQQIVESAPITVTIP